MVAQVTTIAITPVLGVTLVDGRLMHLGEEDSTSFVMNTDINIETIEPISTDAPISTGTSGLKWNYHNEDIPRTGSRDVLILNILIKQHVLILEISTSLSWFKLQRAPGFYTLSQSEIR